MTVDVWTLLCGLFSFQVTAQSGAAHRYCGLPSSQGEKAAGVECEQGGCDGKDETEQKRANGAFYLLLDLY